jgi:hypothetical protein
MGFHPIELRTQALSLAALGISTEDIAASVGLSQRSIQEIYNVQRLEDLTLPRIKGSKWNLLKTPNDLDAQGDHRSHRK